MNNQKFKIGDEVEVIYESAEEIGDTTTCNHASFKRGYIGKVTIVEASNSVPGHDWIYIDGKGGIIDKLLKKVEKQQYKTGDKVWIKEWHYAKIEPQEGVIIDSREDSHQMIPISIKKDHYGNPDTWYFKLSEIEPMKEKQEYEVGQRVIVHSGANISSYNGQEGIIREIHEPRRGYPHLVVHFKNGSNIHVYEDKSTKFNVEIINDNQMKNIPVTKENAKVGMKVKRNNDTWDWREDSSQLPKDTIGEIIGINPSSSVPVVIKWYYEGTEITNGYKYNNLLIAEEQKVYPDKFYVTGGSDSLRNAFLTELVEFGFKLKNNRKDYIDIFPRDLSWRVGAEAKEIHSGGLKNGAHIYTLPQDYEEALGAFKNILVKIPKSKNVTVRKGNSSVTAIVHKDSIKIDGETFAKDHIEQLRTVINHINKIPRIGSYVINPDTINIGCQQGYYLEDLRILLSEWDSLQ